MVTRDPRDGAIYAALDHGHFGVKLQRSDDDGETWTEIATPEYPPVPEGHELKPNPMSLTADPIPWKLKLIWSIEPGSADQPGRLWCGTLPRRPVPIRRSRGILDPRRFALDVARARRVVRRRLRPAGDPLDPRRPARCRPPHPRHLMRRCLAHRRRRRLMGGLGQGHACRVHAAGASVRGEHPGPPPRRAMHIVAGPSLGPAPQRRVPFVGQRSFVDPKSNHRQ